LSSTTSGFGGGKFAGGSMKGAAATGAVSSVSDITQKQDGGLFSRLFTHQLGVGH